MNDDGVGISIPHNDQPTDVPNEAPAIDEVADNESTTLDINAPDSINQNPEEQLESNIPEGPIQPAQMTNPYSSSNSGRVYKNPFRNRDRNETTSSVDTGNVAPPSFSDTTTTNPLAPQPNRDRKKVIKIAGISVGVIALIAIIFLVIIPLISNIIRDQRLSANNREIRAVFNKYANFVLNGTDSDEEIGEYDPNKIYNITSIYRKDDAKALASFYKEANEKYAKVKEKVNELYSEDDEYRTRLAAYSAVFSLSYSHAILGDYPEKDFVETFITEGEDIAAQNVKDFYADYQTEDYSSTYIGDAVNYYDTVLDVLKYYSNHGCTGNKILSGACFNQFSEDPTFKRIVSAQNDALERKRTVMMDANNNVCEKLWSIYEQIKE